MDGIDRDRVSLDTSLGEIEDFFFLPNTIQLLRCGPPKRDLPTTRRSRASPSDPLVGGLPSGRTRIRGSGGGRSPGQGVVLGWTRAMDAVWAPAWMVETRRLELLTLSLQRRRSTD